MSDWNVVGESDVLRVMRRGAAVRLELSRPESLNALDDALATELRDALLRLGADDSVRCLVLGGRGRAFSAGADIRGPRAPTDEARGERTRTVLREQINPAILAIREMRKPVIAAVNGPAVGVGCSLAVACDLVVAAESAYFLLAFANIGLVGDGGATITIPARVGFGRAGVLALLAERVGAADALRWGLADRVVPDAELEETVTALALRLAEGPTRAYAATKRAFNASALRGLADQLELEIELQGELAASGDHREGVAAFGEKRPPIFRGFEAPQPVSAGS
jgi:2-(1,2-epoxy-1,2-dihydrophenyl)acetyl-CoA isomerase